MKKFTFLFAFVFAVSMALGQNLVTTTQTGNNNDSDAIQQGDLQTATVTQTGNNNDNDINQYTDNGGPSVATVIQTGNNNDVDIDMDQVGGGSNTPAITAEIQQIGNYNKSNQKNYAGGYNSGQHLVGYQEGNYNEIDQDLISSYTSTLSATQIGLRNYARQKAEGDQGYKNGTIMTMGNDNTAIQLINNPKATLNITQDGNLNTAKQDFAGTFGFSPANTGDITQTGYMNEAYQHMIAGTEGNDLDGTQIGNTNYSLQKVNGNFNTNSSLVIGNNNDIKINQLGDNNSADVGFNMSGNGLSNGNDVDVNQVGDFNYLLVRNQRGDEGGDNNIINVNHQGNGHFHRVYLDGSSNDIRINASGNVGGSEYDGNRGDWSFQDATPTWNDHSDFNELNLIQTGENNFATGVVAGDYNKIDIKQTGEGNGVGTDWYTTDGVIISGNSNMVDIDQTGTNLNSSFNVITGNGNSISVHQTN